MLQDLVEQKESVDREDREDREVSEVHDESNAQEERHDH